MSITQQPVPEDSLLNTYCGGAHPERWVGQGDCFSVAVAQPVSLSEFVHAFYASPVFRIERAILRVLAGAPSTDAEARGVADGSGSSFAIWRVGERTTTQLLMCDRFEKTRSWFQVVPMEGGGTLLRFGSAVAANRNRKTEALWVGRGFRWLMGFHVLYSRVLLGAALRRVTKK
jgi:hypothetical protein